MSERDPKKEAEKFARDYFGKNPYFQDVFCLNCFAPNCRYNDSCIKCNYKFIHQAK